MKAILFKIVLGFLSLFIINTLTSCIKISRNFYVNELDLHIQIEEISESIYKVTFYKNLTEIGQDYLVVAYKMSEMPSISLNFPINDSSDVFIIDKLHCNVKLYHSLNYNIVYPQIEENNLRELLEYQRWCDFVKSTPESITITMDAYLKSLTLWDGNKKFIRRISPYD